MRLLELYSGIGGMHCALKRALPNVDVVCAIDINDVATSVYGHNFPATTCLNRVIENLSLYDFEGYNADIWTLSPPCQPFTRLGKRKCEADNRTSSLHHLLELIPVVRPKLLLLENVKGFEGSEPWRQLLDVLITNGYQYQFLLTPLQFGIPNCRLRFYLVARLQYTGAPKHFVSCDPIEELKRVQNTPPIEVPPLPDCNCSVCLGNVKHIKNPDSHFTEYSNFCRPVSEFLSNEELIKKTSDIHSVWSSICDDKDAILSFGRNLGLRFFNSREVASLMSFPDNYNFPMNVTEKQRLRLLGNSINVTVVAHIAFWAFSGHKPDIFID